LVNEDGAQVDKLRAIEYFAKVVEAGSFSSAARQLDVSPPAVTKMVAALERELGTLLLRREPRRLLLTPDGDRYLKSCTRLLADLRETEQSLVDGRTRAQGHLVVGISRTVALNCLLPRLASFRRTQPALELEFRTVNYAYEPTASLCDVLLVVGWQEASDWIAHQIARGRYSVVAAPSFWQRHGRPVDPSELADLPVLAHRVPRGVVLDRLKFSRGEERREVDVRPTMVFDDRDSQAFAAASGEGLIFANDITLLPWLLEGRLEQVLSEWIGHEAPPISLMYRRGGRSSAAVRAFGDFATAVFAELMQQRLTFGPPDTSAMPDWFRTRYVGRLVERRS
jgi:LysR family transcriptional regulator, regulator for bpeEF and oprC